MGYLNFHDFRFWREILGFHDFHMLALNNFNVHDCHDSGVEFYEFHDLIDSGVEYLNFMVFVILEWNT